MPLASSVDRFDITASPKNVEDVKRKGGTTDTVQELIAQLAEATGEDAATITASLAKNPDSDFAFVSKLATLEVRGKVRESMADRAEAAAKAALDRAASA